MHNHEQAEPKARDKSVSQQNHSFVDFLEELVYFVCVSTLCENKSFCQQCFLKSYESTLKHVISQYDE